MPITFKKAPPAFTHLECEDYFITLLKRAKRVIEHDDRKSYRAFYSYVTGLLKAGGLSTREMRITREIRNLKALVDKSIETGVTDMTLRGYFDENEL